MRRLTIPRAALPWPTRREAPRLDFLSLLNRKEWHDRARCAHHPSVDPNWFLEERSSGQRFSAGWTDAERKAKTACVKCPVRAECLSDGLYEPFGVWAGTLPAERTRYRHEFTCLPGTMVNRRDHAACIPDSEQVAYLLQDMEDQARAAGLIAEEVA